MKFDFDKSNDEEIKEVKLWHYYRKSIFITLNEGEQSWN